MINKISFIFKNIRIFVIFYAIFYIYIFFNFLDVYFFEFLNKKYGHVLHIRPGQISSAGPMHRLLPLGLAWTESQVCSRLGSLN